MNRYIKFRAWNGFNFESMIYIDQYGNLYGVSEKKYDTPNIEISLIDYDLTIQRYTDKKDMNGVEICEGDIIQSSDLRIAQICWGHKTARFKAIKINMNLDSNDIIGVLLWDECKVIGNIFENPELLQSAQ